MKLNVAKMVDPLTFKRWKYLQAKGIKKVSKSNTKCDGAFAVYSYLNLIQLAGNFLKRLTVSHNYAL